MTITNISIRNQFCPNKSCRYHGKKLEGNVIVHSQKARRMKCKECGRTWSADLDNPQFGLRSEPRKILTAMEMLRKGQSIRKIAQAVDVSTSTIQRWKKRLQKTPINYINY